MSTKNIRFEVSLSITTERKGDWFYAKASNGDFCNSNSESDCVRILTERAKEKAGV